MGITFICVSFVLYIIVLAIQEKRTYHEIMGLIMLIQCIGLTRMRGYPLDQRVYGIMLGFSQYELLFIPNVFYLNFPSGYDEYGYDAVEFAWGNHNFINHAGSCLLVYLVLQLFLLIYFAWDHE